MAYRRLNVHPVYRNGNIRDLPSYNLPMKPYFWWPLLINVKNNFVLSKLHSVVRAYLLTSRYITPLSDEVMSTIIVMAVISYCLVFTYIILF